MYFKGSLDELYGLGCEMHILSWVGGHDFTFIEVKAQAWA